MTKSEFKQLVESRVLFMDGATGSILLKRGMPSGVCNEAWIADNPSIISALQKEYAESGSDILLCPSFGANRETLKEHHRENDVYELNNALFKISKAANPDKIIAGDVSMTGMMVEPMGTAKFEDLVDVYKEQIKALVDAGCDCIVIETIINLVDARAALIAAKETCDLPVLVTMSFSETGVTLYGTTPEAAIISLQGLGADAVGINCSAGPDTMLPIITKMAKFTKVPLIVKPNAGLPKADKDGNTYYDMKPLEFAHHFQEIMKLPVGLFGGCCGTAPEFIKALKDGFNGASMSENPYNRTFEDKMISSERIGAFAKDVEEFEEIDVDKLSMDELRDAVIDAESDFVIFTGKDLAKLEKALRIYNGIAFYDGKGDEIDKELSKILTKYGAELR